MENRVKADLHNHLGRYGTFESFNSVADAASERLGENGILGIANCNDFRYERLVDSPGYERVELGFRKNAIYVPDKKLLVVRGQEIFADEGHVLGVGTGKWTNIASKKLKNVLEELTDLKTARIAVHPGQKDGIMEYVSENPRLLFLIDSWEIYNAEAELWVPGFLPKHANEKAEDFYFREIMEKGYSGIGICSFTDGHGEKEIGRSYTWLPPVDITNPDALKFSLKNGLRETHDLKYLVMRPAKLAALKHAVELKVINKLFPLSSP